MNSGPNFNAIDNVRVAVVSSDMGLQWGENIADNGEVSGNVGGNTIDVPGCDDIGRNGEFLRVPDVTVIEVESGQISCDEGGLHCPDGFNCSDENVCIANDGAAYGAVNCPDAAYFVESTEVNPNDALATQAACLVASGWDECSVDQQLEAAVRGLKKQPSQNSPTAFLVESHLLAVLVVSDEEDCSIRDKELFMTDAWLSGSDEMLHVACHYPEENEMYLFPANAEDAQKTHEILDVPMPDLETYFERFVALKDGGQNAVVFAAIVGVPFEGEGGLSCQGNGLEIAEAGCLEHENMAMEVETLEIEATDQILEFKHLGPACSRFDDSGREIASAIPGRRFVKVAEEFGEKGYIYSICKADWGPAMEKIAEMIHTSESLTCYPQKLNWESRPSPECSTCGQTTCDVVVEYIRSGDDLNNTDCPSSLYAHLSETETESLLARKTVEVEKNQAGKVTHRIVYCPLPQLAMPLDCKEASYRLNQDEVGWFYCENQQENSLSACTDGINNDDDNMNGVVADPQDLVDCDDPDCAACCENPASALCRKDCRYVQELTDAAMNEVSGHVVKTRCVTHRQLSNTQGQGPRNAVLGSVCEQPGFDRTSDSTQFVEGPFQISYQEGCDCLSYADRKLVEIEQDIIVDPRLFFHFCTQECGESGCPPGFVCMHPSVSLDLIPDEATKTFCVPKCIADGCSQERQLPNGDIEQKVCVPRGEDGNWSCVWPE